MSCRRRWLGIIIVLAALSHVAIFAQTGVAQESVQSLLDKARTQEEQKDYAAAERTYQRALSLAPGDWEALKRLGMFYQTELKFEESTKAFERLLASDAQYPEANFLLGISYLALDRFPQAAEAFQRELRTPQPTPRCRYYLALALESGGRTDEAIAQLKLLVADSPKDADALYQLARIHKNASLRAMQALRDIDPDSFQLHALRGEIYADEERLQDAIREYRAALAKRPEMRSLHEVIGVFYWRLNQFDSAEKELLQARQEDLNDPVVNLYLADIAVYEHRFSEAMGFLRIAAADLGRLAQPQRGEVHYLFGKCYLDSKDLQKSKSEFLAAIEADPRDERPHYALAGLYRDLGDTQASARELELFEKLSKAQRPNPLEISQPTPGQQQAKDQ